jgi:hypothetical protein
MEKSNVSEVEGVQLWFQEGIPKDNILKMKNISGVRNHKMWLFLFLSGKTEKLQNINI